MNHSACARLAYFTVASFALLLAAAAPARAAIAWHESIAAAKSAAAASQRQVLVIFTATWSEASERFVQTTLASPEASALVSSCFESVRLDVDAHSDLARKLVVSHLPTACIIDQGENLLARFDCPESAAEFVSNAAKGIQAAALSKTASGASTVTPTAVADPTAPRLSTAPPAWPAEPAVQPTAAAPTPRTAMSAFTAAAAPASTAPVAAPPTARPTIEPQASTPASTPWLGQPASAAPSSPMPAPTAIAAAPTSPPVSGGYPSTPYPVAPQASPAVAAATAPVPPTQPSPSATEKPKSSNPFVAFFEDPASAFKLPTFEWPSFGTSTKKPDVPKPSQSATPQPPTRPQAGVATAVASTTSPAASATDPYGTMPVGLEGYCPVTLVEKSVWVEGRPQWGARHRGRTYLFAGEAEQQRFLAAPDRYSPALSGDDPVLALDSGRQVPGQRRYGVTYQSRIYLFSSPETRNAFTVTPDRYVGRVAMAESQGTVVPGAVVR